MNEDAILTGVKLDVFALSIDFRLTGVKSKILAFVLCVQTHATCGHRLARLRKAGLMKALTQAGPKSGPAGQFGAWRQPLALCCNELFVVLNPRVTCCHTLNNCRASSPRWT